MAVALYKVMLVDDEEDVRQAAIRKLDWTSLGFTVVGEASNGEEALELAERLEPDVIMTDIKMPFMDGLELCRRVKRLLPGTRMAILSGFDEFEYAREAITQQVEHYVLKPVNATELSEVFARIRQSLDEEIAGRRNMEMLRHRYEESLPLLRQQVLLSLLSGHLSAESLARRQAEYALDLSASAYCAAVVRYEAEGDEDRLLSISLRNLIADTLGPGRRFHLVEPGNHLAMVLLLDSDTTPQAVGEALHPVFALSKKLLGLNLHIGLGNIYPRAEDLAHSYREAASALEYQFLLDAGECIYIGDIEPGVGAGIPLDPAYADALFRQIKVGSREDLAGAVSALMMHLRTGGASPQQYQIYLLELITGLVKIIRTYQLDEKEAQMDALLTEGIRMRSSDLEELGHWLGTYCETLRHLARQERKDSVRLLIDKAKDQLHACYMDSALSLDAVCAQLGVSTAYFSTMFKRETGQGFVGYLTDLRMEKALELLNTTDEKTYQIAASIGYEDPNYFSYVFKKRFGVSPSKYRASIAAS